MNESREIQILRAVYWTVEYLDLETGRYERTEFSCQSPLKIPRSGNFEEDSGRICEELIDERDQEIFRNNRSLERLRRNIGNRKVRLRNITATGSGARGAGSKSALYMCEIVPLPG